MPDVFTRRKRSAMTSRQEDAWKNPKSEVRSRKPEIRSAKFQGAAGFCVPAAAAGGSSRRDRDATGQGRASVVCGVNERTGNGS